MAQNKEDMLIELWTKYDYCMMGYSFEQLEYLMSYKEIKRRLKEERDGLGDRP